MKRFSFLIIFLVSISLAASAQDTLPKFTVSTPGNGRVIIGWVNNYGLVKQISIQRSFDSINNFKTIMSVADPNSRQNGYADTKPPFDRMFYRLFVVLGQGQYFFTQAKRPFVDTFSAAKNPVAEKIKDTVFNNNVPKNNGGVKKPEFISSYYVYTNKDGYVFLNLPGADKKKYHVKFFDEDGSFLFEVKNIKESALTLDKTNFLHSGWFKFELYEDDKLIEKNKFYLPKEF